MNKASIIGAALLVAGIVNSQQSAYITDTARQRDVLAQAMVKSVSGVTSQQAVSAVALLQVSTVRSEYTKLFVQSQVVSANLIGKSVAVSFNSRGQPQITGLSTNGNGTIIAIDSTGLNVLYTVPSVTGTGVVSGAQLLGLRVPYVEGMSMSFPMVRP